MQIEILTTAVILMILTHSMLIRKCFDLQNKIPEITEHFSEHTETFENKATDIQETVYSVRELLDEALDVIADFQSSPVQSQVTNRSLSEMIPELLLSRLLPSMDMGLADASETQQKDRPIYEIDPKEVENQKYEFA